MKKDRKETPRRPRDGPTIESSQARAGPCPECGQLAVGVWKGGGFNIGNQQGDKDKDMSQENYIKSLQQQIKILELEIAYLKKQNEGEEPPKAPTVHDEPMETRKLSSPGSDEAVKRLKSELQSSMARAEHMKMEKNKTGERLKVVEQYREEEKGKYLEQISRLTGRVENLEKEAEDREGRQSSLLQDLEKQAIISKDRERSIQQLTEDLDARKEEVTTLTSQVEHLQTEVGGKQTIITQLQEKFMQSSQHIMQETVKGLQDELKESFSKVKDLELKEEEWKQIKERMESVKTGLIEEIADLKAQLANVKSELDGEIRTREHRNNRATMDAQDLTMLREKEQQLKAENSRLQSQMDKQIERMKSVQDKLTGESHLVTSQELRISTQKSRIAELEGMLVLASEQNNNMRRQNLSHTDKHEMLRKDIEQARNEYNEMATRLAESEARLAESDRRVDELVQKQSQRWDEFCKMADSMKNLSSDMLSQGQANKAINRS
eukprot:TRINITY_DN45680_c0_g1_i1.p1 TRINITY_DN45680_c0_g1~~TRINITY_DN45680_c0_g1_i1.p1  ORF type:complete len:494 (-),score=153.56 TRINITY_DN45680_c0_g1_i1:17-1498(-)